VSLRPTTLFSHPIISAILLLSIFFLTFPNQVSGQAELTPDTTEIIASTIVEAAPVTSLLVEDGKYDNADSLMLFWVPSIDDQIAGGKVVGYRVYRSVNGGEATPLSDLLPGAVNFTDKNVEQDSIYVYHIATLTASGEYPSVRTQEISPEPEYFNFARLSLLLIALIIAGAVIFYVETAKRGKELFVRKIAGLEAIDEAVGRATEMGRPVLFIPGINDMDDVQTLAALTILGRVSRTIAEYDSKIFMPVSRSLVMTAARETIKASYQAAGRPDGYSDDMVNYVTDEQFGYVAAVDGIMVRERPATVFLLGAFFAESLILAETGNSVGAIQIAGTARPAQLPFFIAACDFTLIGEELFAASAYLSGEPRMLGSLKGQDVGKAIAMIVIFVGVITVTMSEAWGFEFMKDIHLWLMSVFTAS
jgi:hypothetical protein